MIENLTRLFSVVLPKLALKRPVYFFEKNFTAGVGIMLSLLQSHTLFV